GRLFFRAIIGLFAFLPFLPPSVAPFVLVAARSLASVPGAMLNVSIQTIWGRGIAPDRRPRMLSLRMAIHGIVAAIVGFLSGQWLDSAPYPLNYQLLFVVAFLAGIGSALILGRIKLPQAPAQSTSPRKRVGLKDMLLLIRSVPAFSNYALAAFIFRMGASLPSALFTIYRVRTLGASDAWIGILLTIERALSVVAYLTLGHLLRRPRFRRYLWLAGLGNVLFPLSMALVRTPELLVIPSAIIGLFSGGMSIFLQNTVLRVSPESQRPTFAAADSFLANTTAFVAPMLGTTLADFTGIRLAFVMASTLRLVGVLAFWRLKVGSEK
ncbi:MAG: MFS transporter, partial [Anaerolineae bacterium]|nr:MFS transporter [Anaerolineae bacterium]